MAIKFEFKGNKILKKGRAIKNHAKLLNDKTFFRNKKVLNVIKGSGQK